MENKLYLLREIYDSLSYRLSERALNFHCTDNSFVLGARRTGKTTMAFLEAIVEGALHDRSKIGLFTDSRAEMNHFILLSHLCDDLGLEYSKDSYNRTIVLPNGSTIKITSSKPSHRGERYDYIVADIHDMNEEEYYSLLCLSHGNFKILAGQHTDFVHNYIQNNHHMIIPFALGE